MKTVFYLATIVAAAAIIAKNYHDHWLIVVTGVVALLLSGLIFFAHQKTVSKK